MDSLIVHHILQCLTLRILSLHIQHLLVIHALCTCVPIIRAFLLPEGSTPCVGLKWLILHMARRACQVQPCSTFRPWTHIWWPTGIFIVNIVYYRRTTNGLFILLEYVNVIGDGDVAASPEFVTASLTHVEV